MRFLVVCVFLVVLGCNFSSYSAGKSLNLSHRFNKHSHRIWCLNDQFTCSPTQCVDYSVLCDGVNDCDDGSDESPELCKSLNPRSCILPKEMEDKSYVVNCKEDYKGHPNEYVPELSLLSYACKPGYTREQGNTFQSFCLNSTWTPAIPACSKSCHLPNTPNMKYWCYRKGKEVPCDTSVPPGTKIYVACENSFYHPNEKEITCTENGEWDIKNIKCEAVCGKYTEVTDKLLQGKTFPWHVVITRKELDNSLYTFAGTLITPNLVLTVARSAVDGKDEKLAVADFEVIVNNTMEDEHQTRYTVKDIHFTTNGFHSKDDLVDETDDIAILVLSKSVEVSDTVMPVCVDWAGWHMPESGMFTGKIVRIGTAPKDQKLDKNEIYTIKVMGYDQKTCVGMIPGNVIQHDQFCANATEPKVTGTSDYGVAMCSRNPDTGIHWMRGVLRVTYGPDGMKVFTDVSKHSDWINIVRHKVENKFEIDESMVRLGGSQESGRCSVEGECTLRHTDHPPLSYSSLLMGCSNGKVEMKFSGGCTLPVANNTKFEYDIQCPHTPQNDLETYCKRTQEGDYVPEYSTLTTWCKCGYSAVSRKTETSVCFNGQWKPDIIQCKPTCRKLKLQNVNIKCSYEEKPIECSSDLVIGTRVSLACLPGYAPESPPKHRNLTCDEDGEWDGTPYRCSAVCGRPSVNDTYGSGDGRDVRLGEFPWHVAIYDKTKDNELVCSGTILTENTILTAAHCFYDPVLKEKRNPYDFLVAVSKITKDKKIKDSSNSLFYEVDLIILKNYYDSVWKYFNDIAVLKLKSKIVFNSEVSQICMQYDKPIPSGHPLQTLGWGRSTNSVLRFTEDLNVNLTECISAAPDMAKEFILEDKACLHSPSYNFADSGSGVYYYDKSSSSYHIAGVVAHHVPDFPSTTIYTNIQYHIHWIRAAHSSLQRIKY